MNIILWWRGKPTCHKHSKREADAERDRENEIWMQKISFKDFADSFETNLKASSSFKSGLFADKSTYLTSPLE